MDTSNNLDNLDNTPEEVTKDQFAEMPIKDFSYVNSHDSNIKPPKNKSGKYITIIILLILIIGGAASYFIVSSHKPKPKVVKVSVYSQANSSTSSNIGGPTTSFDSSNFSLTVDYPKSWVVNSSNSTSLSFTSPTTTLKSDLGKSTSGRVVLSVYQTGELSSQITSNDTVAVLPSQLFSYTNPTPSQAAQAYLSFFQYPTTTVIGGMDAMYITGNLGYVKAQNVLANDLGSLDPVVNVTFIECLNQTCSQNKPLTISSTMWNDNSFQNPILNMIKSFTFS